VLEEGLFSGETSGASPAFSAAGSNRVTNGPEAGSSRS
jgi:hypothetical protein